MVEVIHNGQGESYPADCRAMVTLEKCKDLDVENTSKFLRWMPDDALKDIWGKHMKALEQRTPTATRG